MRNFDNNTPEKQTGPGTSPKAQDPEGKSSATGTPSEHHGQPSNEETYLNSLSKFAGHSFTSMQDMQASILQLVVDLLGMRSSFLTRINDPERGRHEVIMAHNLAGGCGVQAGVRMELSQTF